MARPIAIALLLLAMAGPIACQVDQKYSQTELTALQTREFPATYDATFDAAINALFDAGYTIRSSDKRGGFLSAFRSSVDTWRGPMSAVVQFKIESAGPQASTIRISTTDGGQQRINKQQLDELFNLIERRLGSAAAPYGGRP